MPRTAADRPMFDRRGGGPSGRAISGKRLSVPISQSASPAKSELRRAAVLKTAGSEMGRGGFIPLERRRRLHDSVQESAAAGSSAEREGEAHSELPKRRAKAKAKSKAADQAPADAHKLHVIRALGLRKSKSLELVRPRSSSVYFSSFLNSLPCEKADAT